MTAGCTLTDVFACHCSVRLCWNGAFFARERLTIRRTFRAFCAEQGKTALLAQWDIERNLPLTPDDVTFGSHKRVWWTCPNGHSWQAMVYTRSEGTGCPYCTGRKASPEQNSLTKQFPALAAEWDDEKNAPLTPQDVTPGSHKLIWWRCPKGHSYRSAVKTRVQGSGCPYCAGKNVLPEETSLAAEYPSIAKEWDAAKNVPLLPTQVISGTRRKVWWRCPKGHSWRAAVYSRTTLGTGCPVCTGRQALAGENDLATLYPDIAAQWDEEKNGVLHPNNVTAGSNRRVVEVRKRPLLSCDDRAARAARRRLSLLRQPKGAAGFQRLSDRSAAGRQTVAREPQRRADTGDGDRGQPQKSVVAMLLRPCLESHHLLARGRAAVRLPRLRRKDQTQNQVNSAREGGQKIENLRR